MAREETPGMTREKTSSELRTFPGEVSSSSDKSSFSKEQERACKCRPATSTSPRELSPPSNESSSSSSESSSLSESEAVEVQCASVGGEETPARPGVEPHRQQAHHARLHLG